MSHGEMTFDGFVVALALGIAFYVIIWLASSKKR